MLANDAAAFGEHVELLTDAALTPHQLRHAHAVEMAREGVPLIVIQRQFGHSNPSITSVYLQGVDSGEIIETVHARRAPMMPVSVSLQLCSIASGAAHRALRHSLYARPQCS